MKTVNVVIEHAETNLSAYVEDAPIITIGDTIEDIEKNIREAINLYLETCKDENIDPGKVFEGEYELKFQLDAPTFINYYSNIFTKAALSRVTGINERQLWRYAAGKNVPRKEQLEKFQKGINKLTRELQSISFL